MYVFKNSDETGTKGLEDSIGVAEIKVKSGGNVLMSVLFLLMKDQNLIL